MKSTFAFTNNQQLLWYIYSNIKTNDCYTNIQQNNQQHNCFKYRNKPKYYITSAIGTCNIIFIKSAFQLKVHFYLLQCENKNKVWMEENS